MMNKLLPILLILPAVSFSQSFDHFKREGQPANKLETLHDNTIDYQMEQMEPDYFLAPPLKNGMAPLTLLDSTRTYLFKSSMDSTLIDRTLLTYFSSGILKIKSNYFWNDQLKKMLNNKYEYLYDRSGKLTSVTFNEWWFSHFDAYTSSDGIFHPEVDNTINYLTRYNYAYDYLGNQTSFLLYDYEDQSRNWYLQENYQYFYDSERIKTSMSSWSWIGGLNIIKELYTYDQKKNLATINKFNQISSVWINTGKTQYDYTYDSDNRVKSLLTSYWSFKAGQWKNTSKVDYSYHENGGLKSRIYSIIDTTRNEMVPANKTDYKYNKIDKIKLREDFAWNKTTSQWELRKKQYYYYNYSGPITHSDENSLTNKMPFRMFPNPVKDILWIENTDDYSILHIYNDQGQCVKTDVIEKGMNTINMVSLPKGIYIITISMENELKSCKLVVE